MDRLVLQTIDRVSSLLRQVDRLCDSASPQPGSLILLDLIRKRLEENITDANNAGLANIEVAARIILSDLFALVPYLGLAQRSSNPRIAFEIYEPLRYLASKLIKSNSCLESKVAPDLLISSEWDYSPFYYAARDFFLQLILLRLPACESDNPLILPLMGHEIGHAFWHHMMDYEVSMPDAKFSNIPDAVCVSLYRVASENWAQLGPCLGVDTAVYKNPTADDIMKSTVLKEALGDLFQIASYQAEETFCDFLGIRLFPQSFYNAFSYYLSPGVGLAANSVYPSLTTRISHMGCMAAKFGLRIPNMFVQAFPVPSPSKPFPIDPNAINTTATVGSEEWLCSLADLAVRRCAEDLCIAADMACRNADIPWPEEAEIDRVSLMISNSVPVDRLNHLGALLDGAWNVQESLELNRLKAMGDKKEELLDELKFREAALREAVLKSVEIMSLNV